MGDTAKRMNGNLPHLSIADVESLQDNGSIPWVMANACDTAKFTSNSIGSFGNASPLAPFSTSD